MNQPVFLLCRQLLLLALFHGYLLAQDPFVIRSFDPPSPADQIQAMLQDRQGFIWFGGYNGLYRFDGYRYIHYSYDPADPHSLNNSSVWSIAEDARGNLWVATSGGVNRFDPQTERFTAFPFPSGEDETPDRHQVRAIFADSRGSIWAGTFYGRLYRLDLATIQWTTFPVGPPDPHTFVGGAAVRCFYEDTQGYLWIGSGLGLSRFDFSTETFRVFQHNPKDPHSIGFNYVWTIFEDNEGVLWIGGNGGGLSRFDRKTGRFTLYRHEPGNPASISGNAVYGICQDHRGLLWIATQGGGVNCLDTQTGRFTAYTQKSPPPYTINNNSLYCLMKDRQGLIWIGSENGVNRLDFQYKPFQKYFYQADPSLNSSERLSIQAILEDYTGTLWLGTSTDGLIRFNRSSGQITHYRRDFFGPVINPGNRILALAEDNTGHIWIGHYALDRLDPRTGEITHYRTDPRDSTNFMFDVVRRLFKDRSGKIWIHNCGDNSLQYFDEMTARFVSFRNMWVCMMAEEREGVFWLATWGQGIYRWDQKNNELSQYLHDPANPNSLASDNINVLFISSEGTLWMNALGRGLNRMDPLTGRFTLYDEKDGLPNKEVMGILEDDHQRLWVSTRSGLSCFDPTTGVFQNYFVGDGLPANDFLWSAFRSPRTGEFFFGTTNGLLVFHPDSIRNNPHIPPVMITGFQIGNRPMPIRDSVDDTLEQPSPLLQSISYAKELQLNWRQNDLAFEFTALNFVQPEKNRYKYQLQNYDKTWIATDARRTFANYTNLDPGRYTFRVIGSNNDGVWNEEGAAIKIYIRPPWWWNAWSKTLYVLLFLSGLWALRRYEKKRGQLRHELELEQVKSSQLQEVNELKSHFFSNISHEFRTPLTLIYGPLQELITRRPRADLPVLQGIERNTQRLLILVNQLLDLSKLDGKGMKLQAFEGDLVTFVRQIFAVFTSTAEAKNIYYTFHSEQESLRAYFDPDKLEKILANLLGNAFKFTPAGEKIQLMLEHVVDVAQITISDSGPGIPEKDLPHVFDRFYQAESGSTRAFEGTGVGLALVKELTELHRGTVTAENITRGGARFTLRLPLGADHLREEEIIAAAETPAIATTYIGNLPEALSIPRYVEWMEDELALALIVEDNADMRTYIRQCLAYQYRVIEASEGRLGLNSALEHAPDLIISDVMMPGIDGVELCKQLKNDERTSHIPIVLLTAKADLDARIEGLGAGADAYLSKPFHKEELLVTLRKLLDLRRELQKRYQSSYPALSAKDVKFQKEDAFIQKLRKLIEENLADPEYDMAQLCRKLFLSRAQLYRKVKALTGESVGQYIQGIRLHKARELLQTTDLAVSEVAYQVGFKDPAYFSRVFSKLFGANPSETR